MRIDLAWMLRTGRTKEGAITRGTLHWTRGREPAGSISYVAEMHQEDEEQLRLTYSRGEGEDKEQVEQTVRLYHTRPNYGGKRWWMNCPYHGVSVGKLYLPPGGDRFASRQAWQLGYQSQRISQRDRPFEALFRLQKKLECEQGWGNWITRPKGMHHRTFERHVKEFEYLDNLCAAEMMTFALRLGGRRTPV
jgi:hypothetical protein